MRALALLVPLVAFAAVIPASAHLLSPAHAEDPETTYYLHSATTAQNGEQIAEFTVDVANAIAASQLVDPATLAPFLDANAPTGPVKAVATSALGNDAFRKNFLLAYWAGPAQGRLHDATARIWVVASGPTEVTATLFGDGGVGSGSPFAQASATAAGGAPELLAFDFGDAAGNVDNEIVLSLHFEVLDRSVVILYDDPAFDSSLTFRLGDVIVNPPPSWTSAPGWGPVTLINTSAAHRETSLALSPTHPNLLLACAPSGVPNTEFGQSYFHVSRDAGATWQFLDVETGSTDPRRFAFEGGDCDVAFDAAGTLYSADTWLGSLSVGHSTDGGHTWTGTALAASAPIVDRPWLVGGPEGVVHVTWQDVQFGMPSAIWYSRSDDFGMTFTPPVSVARANEQGAFTWTGNFEVTPDGQHLYSVYTRRQGPAIGSLDNQGPETVWVAASHDRGLTWTSHLVANTPNPASFLYPSLGLDEGGKLHVVYSSRTDNDRPIWYTTSADQAQTWTAPAPVLSGVAGWSPWVVGGADGEAAIQWYGTLDPLGNTSADYDWYFFTARVQDGNVHGAGTTTTTPIFSGIQSAIPEFNQVRLADGKLHLGASAFLDLDGSVGWALFYQRET